MSPEQARGDVLDERSDLFSLGVTLYELATCGLGPYTVDRSDKDAILGAVRAGQMRPLRHFATDVPEDLARVIEKAIRPVPADRYQTAAEMLAYLEGVAAPTPPPPTAAVPP